MTLHPNLPKLSGDYTNATFLPENALNVAHAPIPYPLVQDAALVLITAPVAGDELVPEPFPLSSLPSLLSRIRQKVVERSSEGLSPFSAAVHSQYIIYWHRVSHTQHICGTLF